MKEVLTEAKAGGYAVPAFCFGNAEVLHTVLDVGAADTVTAESKVDSSLAGVITNAMGCETKLEGAPGNCGSVDLGSVREWKNDAPNR